MPTYEYECKDCGHTFEVFQSMSDAPLKICPECGKEVRRLINGGSGVIFKGSGFYVTDKKSGNTPAKTKDGETKSAETKSSTETGASSAASSGGSPSPEKPAAKKTETAASSPPAAAARD